MSDFVSVHDVVFGNRPPETSESNDNGSRKTTITVRPDEAPVDIQLVASTVELDGIFCFDDFGRFGLANDEQKDKILNVLKVYGRVSAFSHTEELDRYEAEISDQTKFSEWHMFGWLIGELPNFEACYQQWKINNEMDGKVSPSMLKVNQDPYPQNRIWKFMSLLLEDVIGEVAYEQIKKGDYTSAISALQGKGMRWSVHEKQALRRHLKTIVTSA
tara:strand:- start:40 stop:687 length:648 start_codon:yes stop_codon:yes gene_type:complete